jgi:hypothetical protein
MHDRVCGKDIPSIGKENGSESFTSETFQIVQIQESPNPKVPWEELANPIDSDDGLKIHPNATEKFLISCELSKMRKG